MRSNLAINIGKLKLRNPVMAASGTFGYAEEFKDFIDLSRLGAIVTKTITLKPRPGNSPARTCETPAGMLNSIGLENPGIDEFLRGKLPFLKKLSVPLIVSIASEGDNDEFVSLARRLEKIKEISAIELNISCPNIKGPRENHRPSDIGRRLIAQDAKAAYALVKSVRGVTKKTLITKLSPNVTDIAEIARAAQEAGTDGLSLINTLMGMSIDIRSRRPKTAAILAGLSGPAIRPVALRMVWEVFKKVRIPIIGMGGIMDTESALEFFIAGSSAIAAGTANFINPRVTIEIIEGLKTYLEKNKIRNMRKLIGSLQI